MAFKGFQYSMFALSRGLISCIKLTLKSKWSTHRRQNTQHNLYRGPAGLLNRCLNPIWRMLTGPQWIDYWCNYKQNHWLLVSLANMKQNFPQSMKWQSRCSMLTHYLYCDISSRHFLSWAFSRKILFVSSLAVSFPIMFQKSPTKTAVEAVWVLLPPINF